MCKDLKRLGMHPRFIIQRWMRFFVTHFVKGLKGEIQGLVMAQLPSTIDIAQLLAQVQQEILEKNRFKMNKPLLAGSWGR